jgi:CHASE2 domain-containing sensor protein
VSKLVKLKIGKATTNNSYQVCLQISQKQRFDRKKALQEASDPIEVEGELPIPSKLLQAHQDWRGTYDRLDISKRGGEFELDTDLPAHVSIDERIEECKNAGKKVVELFNSWLKSDSFAEIRESLQKELGSMDEIQAFLQIDESLPELARLPWQETDFFKRERLTEVALIKQKINKIEISSPINSQVRILAVLGNSENLDVEADRKILESSGAYVEFLDKPNQKSLYTALSKQQWDIFFFAGHSSSVGAEGNIYVNDRDRGLTFEDISNAVNRAVENGLKIAILNSCDGLELGKSLSKLQVPQIIFMREPVPDIVAHTFLKEFVCQYSSEGKSFYSSVRYAREELQKLQGEFPCATWLPTIYQSSTNYPLNWAQLMVPPEPLPEPVNTRKFYLSRALLTGLIATIAISATRLTGILQPLELTAFDHAMKLRPIKESVDSKMLVIGVTEEDRLNLKPKPNGDDSSLSNESLNRLLAKLKSYQPKIIGIDIMLDRDIGKQYTFIHDSLTTGDLVAACTTPGSTGEKNEHKPPEGANLFGFADLNWDGDNSNSRMIRRQLLSMDAKNIKPGILCNQPYALSTMLAMYYLQAEGIELKIAKDRTLQIGPKKYPLLTTYAGNLLNGEGGQILLNYRLSENSPIKAIPSISLKEFLDLSSDSLKQLVDGKLILIGTTDPLYRDDITTPYGSIPGVYLQAQMASQLISAALDRRYLISPYPLWGDILIIFGAATIGALLALLLKNRWVSLGLVGGVLLISISIGSIGLLLIGQWFPLIPTLIALFLSGIGVKIHPLLETKLKSLSSNSPAIVSNK